MHDELWHVRSGNLVNTFERECDALDVVPRTHDHQGLERVEDFALGTEDRLRRSAQVAIGSDLLVRALNQGPGDAASVP